ncbi:MAG: putative phage repressor [Magnetococcales bacterium]|nr:putative phage repressor [Magnetococcales bacterium]HIJ85229.1 hypothetical protein [Magnetococcales bacterium]
MSEKQTQESFGERLKKVIGPEPYAWADQIGLGKSTLAGLLSNVMRPQTRTLMKIADKTDISISWLLTGKGSPWINISSSPFPEDPTTIAREPGEHYRVLPPPYVFVPRFRIRTDGKTDDSFYSGQVIDHITFKSDWIIGTMQLDPKNIALVSIIGDSMEPTLKEGDMVLLDQRDRNMRNDAIYVMRRDEDLVAKRLQRGFDGSVTIKSDNLAYEDIRIAPEQVGQLAILGRAVWIGRRI